MDNFLSLFAHHGLLAVFIGVLVEQLGAPLPALPFLLLAGAAAAGDGVLAVKALAVATLASMMADSLWFLAGRRFGRRVLAFLCRISLSPDSCVRQSEASFARRGVATLVVAKFVPGLSTLAPPLAGALGMSGNAFAIFNLAGTLLWAGSGIAAGLVFHGQIGWLLGRLDHLGNLALGGLGLLLGIYLAWRAWRRWRVARSLARLPRVRPGELADLLARGTELIIMDVRAALPLPPEGRIPGARHVELAALETALPGNWPVDVEMVTYCACPNDASALKAAHLLSRQGYRVRVLAGGIDAWADAGYQLEAAASPAFG